MGEKFEPNEDQLRGIKFGMQKSYGAYFWDPGTRKTSTILFVFKLLRDMGLVKRMLVTSTLNIVNDVWPAEMERWDDLDLTYAPLVGGASKRRKGLELDADVYLLNIDSLEPFYNEWGKFKAFPFDMLYADESSKFRNLSTDRFRALRKMLVKFKRRYIGTGTPIPKDYLNLYAQMFIVDMGELLGPTMGGYKLKFFEPGGFKGKQWTLREGADEEIWNTIAPRVSRVEKQLNVTMTFEDVMVDLPTKARRAYDELEIEFITEWQGKTITAMNAAVASGKLRQAANGAIYYDREHNWTKLHTAKCEALAQLIKQLKGKPLLLAYEYDHDYEMLQRFGIKFPSYSEAKPGAQRTALLKRWNDGDFTVLGGQIGAMSHGLNAQHGGCNLAYYGMNFDLEAVQQFYQRLWRDGQLHNVTGWRIMARNTVDEVALQVVNGRDATQGKFLSALKRRYDL